MCATLFSGLERLAHGTAYLYNSNSWNSAKKFLHNEVVDRRPSKDEKEELQRLLMEFPAFEYTEMQKECIAGPQRLSILIIESNDDVELLEDVQELPPDHGNQLEDDSVHMRPFRSSLKVIMAMRQCLQEANYLSQATATCYSETLCSNDCFGQRCQCYFRKLSPHCGRSTVMMGIRVFYLPKPSTDAHTCAAGVMVD